VAAGVAAGVAVAEHAAITPARLNPKATWRKVRNRRISSLPRAAVVRMDILRSPCRSAPGGPCGRVGTDDQAFSQQRLPPLRIGDQ
jgi:hypothetical protein